MNNQQEYWHSLQRKYEENNKTLEKRQLELQLKLDAIDAVIGDGKKAIHQERGLTLDSTTPEQNKLQGSEFKSCSCSRMEDKGGFFKCVFSLFGSNKSKGSPPASPVPQEIPTREDKKPDKDNVITPPNTTMRSAGITQHGADLRNENCMCNPCEAFDQSFPQKDGDSRCSCSICSKENLIKKQSNDSMCHCSTCSRGNGKLCACDYGREMELGRRPYLENMKTASLNSMDLFYMQNIHDLATHHKKLLKDVAKLETQTKIYDDVLKSCNKPVDAAPRGYHLNESIMPPSDPDQKSSADLKLENFLLKNELKEMRLEVRQYIERMEGPMQFKIESERFKCQQLEQKLEEAKKEHLETQDFLQKEINSLKMQQCNSNKKIYDLTTANEQLTENLENLKARSAQLQDELVRQKISEAETLKRMKAALEDARNNANGAVKDECSLHHIARELSKILAECEPCEQCITLPEDLTEAAKLLKSLTDMVDRKLPQTESGRKTDAVPASVKKLIDDIDETPNEPRSSEIGSPKIAEAISSKGSKVSEMTPVPSEQPEKVALEVEAPPPEATEPETAPREVKISDPEEQSPDVPVEQVPQSEEVPKESAQVPKESPGDAITIPEPYSVEVQEEGGESVKIKAPDDSSSLQPRSAPIADSSGIPPKKSSCKCVKSSGRPRAAAIEQKPSVPVDETKKKRSCKCSRKTKGVTEKPSEPVEARSSALKGGKSCKCNKKSDFAVPVEQAPTAEAPSTALVPVSRKGDGVDQIWPKGSERFKLSHQVTASRSQEMLKSETSVKCLKVKENFPFEVDTQVDVLNRPPDGVHVTTTITNSGTLEVITEGPEGVIETTLIYTTSGNVEVVTEILEHKGRKGLCNRGKIKATSPHSSPPKALEAPATLKGSASEPAKTSDALSGVDVTARSSEPLNPNCKCIECPGLGPKGADTSGKENAVGPVQERAAEIVQPDAVQTPTFEEIVIEQHITEDQLALTIQADSPDVPASDTQEVPASDAPAVPASDTPEGEAPKSETPDSA